MCSAALLLEMARNSGHGSHHWLQRQLL